MLWKEPEDGTNTTIDRWQKWPEIWLRLKKQQRLAPPVRRGGVAACRDCKDGPSSSTRRGIGR
eukprot:4367111-Prymnesium_polylepis.1